MKNEHQLREAWGKRNSLVISQLPTKNSVVDKTYH